MLLPVICALWYSEFNVILSFIVPALISAALGFVAIFFTKKYKSTEIGARTGAIIVVACWIIVIFLGSIPFMMAESMTFTNAIFESTSGWTTTGFTIIDVTLTSKAILLWRSLTQFLGGIGVILVLQILIPSQQTTMLYQTEGHGERVLPNMKKTLRLIVGIYILYTFVGMILYIIGGMSVFDAINHSMTALATGGFSTRAGSIGEYNSLYIEIVTIFLMLLGGINFAVHILIFTGQIKKVSKIFELKVMTIVLIIFIPLLAFVGFSTVYATAGERFKAGIFETVSTMTSTGFLIRDSKSWSGFAMFLITFLMLMGANLGSTSGGIKQYRIGLAVKSFYWNIKTHIMNEKKVYQPYIYNSADKVFITQEDILKNNTFILVYLTAWFLGAGIMSMFGFSFDAALFESASVLGNTGLTMGVTTAYNPLMLWIMSAGMLLGRLEFNIIFIAFGKIISDAVKNVRNIKRRAK